VTNVNRKGTWLAKMLPLCSHDINDI
jgi:hypothetical protein